VSASRFGKVLSVARGVKAFLGFKNSFAWDVTPHAGQREKVKNRKLSRAKSERRVAEKRAKRDEHRRRSKRTQREIVDHEVLDKQHDPSQERIETAHLRQLPDFVIIGTQRGGTTSLYRYLTDHPDVGAALRKEIHFFDRHYHQGMNWYLAHFPTRGENPAVGEASPNYLLHPDVPERARRDVPHAKFIALLRNPVDRAYSQYQMNVRRGIESLTFEDAIDKERERLNRCNDPASPTWRQYSYTKRGLYREQLERWMSVFPREQFLIVKSEDFYRSPERVVRQTLTYLGLRSWSPADFKAYHLVEYPDMDPATRKHLAEYFAPYNKQLYTLLGRNLEWEHA
jgi:hypothetical protein